MPVVEPITWMGIVTWQWPRANIDKWNILLVIPAPSCVGFGTVLFTQSTPEAGGVTWEDWTSNPIDPLDTIGWQQCYKNAGRSMTLSKHWLTFQVTENG